MFDCASSDSPRWVLPPNVKSSSKDVPACQCFVQVLHTSFSFSTIAVETSNLLIDDASPSNIDQDGTAGQEFEPLLVNHPAGGGGARQGHHQHLGFWQQGVQAGNWMDSHPVLPPVLLLDGCSHPDHVEPETQASSSHEGSDSAVAKHQASSTTQQHLQD